jgi:hypothetical protein
MNRDKLIELARQADFPLFDTKITANDVSEQYVADAMTEAIWNAAEHFAALIIEHDRKELEEKLLNLKYGVASVSQYVQGRWDLIGEFQDILREKP